MTLTTAPFFVAPQITPVKGSLLDAASVTNDFAWLTDVGLYDSFNCMQFQSEAEFCAPNSKTFDNQAVWQDGFRFAAYGGVNCKAVGLDQSRMLSEVTRVFEAGESVAVERAFMRERFAARTDYWDAPEDLTPAGGAVSPAAGIALLEGYAGSVYVGAPTLHVPRTVASLVLGVNGAEFQGNVLQTRLGSKIAAGSGYDYPNLGPDGTPAPDGEKWLYATGEVSVGRSEAVIRQVMALEDNDVFVLGERAYIGAAECFAAAVRVQVTA